MSYLINTQNTGLATDEQARAMADILKAKGFDVEFTRNWGLVNPSESCPCIDAEWEAALIEADKMAPETETWEAWLDGKRDEAVTFEVPRAGTFDVAQAGADALGVDVCEELNVARV